MPLDNDDIICSQLVAAAQMIAKSISAITFRERLGPWGPGALEAWEIMGNLEKSWTKWIKMKDLDS